jgi:Ca2+-binding EF-hand superfamily protein
LGRTVADTINVDSWTWFQLWGLNVFMYLLLLAYPPKGRGSAVVCGAWLALGYLEAVFIVYFYRRCLEVKWCLCLPEEVPHVAFRVPDPATGVPRARPHFAPQPQLLAAGGDDGGDDGGGNDGEPKVGAGGYQSLLGGGGGGNPKSPTLARTPSALVHCDVSLEMRSLTRQQDAARAAKAALAAEYRAKGMSVAAAEQLAQANAGAAQLEGGDRGSPPWASVAVARAARSKWRQWLGGRAPFRQMYLYWGEGRGPDLHVRVLRLHLVYVSIQVTLLVLAFAPLVREHFGGRAYWAYLAAPVPHVVYTLGFVLAPLTRVVTEIGCAGILKDQKAIKEVIRMMKTEKSVKGLVLLTGMQLSISEARRKKKSANKKEQMRAAASKGEGSAEPGRRPNGADEAKGDEPGPPGDADFLTTVARELFASKFVAASAGPGSQDLAARVGPVDFAGGLNRLAAFTDAEAARAFALADVTHAGSVSGADFAFFFKRLHHRSAWKSVARAADTAAQGVAARLHGCFQVAAAAKEDKANGVGLSAEEELSLLHREHGRAVHEIVTLFDQHDTNGDGSLDQAEVRVMISNLGQELSEAEAQQLVGHLDRDGDGEVSMAEFVVWAFKRQQATKPMDVEELAGEIFDLVFDTTADGKIDVNEFIAGLEHVKSALTYDEKHELFREADENAGGFIDKEEFVALILKYSDEVNMH